MVAHAAGNAGGPPPPTEREAALHAEIEWLSNELRLAQEVIDTVDGILSRLPYRAGRGELAVAIANIRKANGAYFASTGEPTP